MRISDWSSDVCSSDLDLDDLDVVPCQVAVLETGQHGQLQRRRALHEGSALALEVFDLLDAQIGGPEEAQAVSADRGQHHPDTLRSPIGPAERFNALLSQNGSHAVEGEVDLAFTERDGAGHVVLSGQHPNGDAVIVLEGGSYRDQIGSDHVGTPV